MSAIGKIQNANQRVWEIDALRGLLILCVLVNHLILTITAFCINGYYSIDSAAWATAVDPLRIWFQYDDSGVLQLATWFTDFRWTWTYPIVDVFFVVSGLTCAFSRNNLKRALRVLAAGLFVAAFTFGLWQWTDDPTRFIRFGVLMCYACCQLIYVYFLENKDNETLFMVAAPVFAVGYYLRYHGTTATRLPIFYIFGVPQIGDMSSDFWPIFPMLGWFLLGVVIGRKYYSQKTTLFPNQTAQKLTLPLQFLGRHSGAIYVGHILLYTIVFTGIGTLFGLL